MLAVCVRGVESLNLVDVEVREVDLTSLFSRTLHHLNAKKYSEVIIIRLYGSVARQHIVKGLDIFGASFGVEGYRSGEDILLHRSHIGHAIRAVASSHNLLADFDVLSAFLA